MNEIHAEQTPFKPEPRSFTELERDDIVRGTLKEVEKRLLDMRVNNTYRAAFKVAIKILNGMKP